MNHKEFQDSVDFSLVLNEWATEQPGYKSPVTEADVEGVMAKIQPLLRPKEKLSDQAQLKYQALVQIIKKESSKPKPKLAISMQVKVVDLTEEQKKELLKEKLVEEVGGKLLATELGRRFVVDFEKVMEK